MPPGPLQAALDYPWTTAAQRSGARHRQTAPPPSCRGKPDGRKRAAPREAQTGAPSGLLHDNEYRRVLPEFISRPFDGLTFVGGLDLAEPYPTRTRFAYTGGCPAGGMGSSTTESSR
jgi:hypothetical protein